MIRTSLFAMLAVAATSLTSSTVWADGRCDLNTVVGYSVILAKPIVGYIENGMRTKGYDGCQPDRVLVFADNSGVKCKGAFRQRASALPTGYLFARDMGDMKLCVDGELFNVSQTN